MFKNLFKQNKKADKRANPTNTEAIEVALAENQALLQKLLEA